jgi:GH25 family lysozyme M1 (1,4-beta-N-acetylmuramidase)
MTASVKAAPARQVRPPLRNIIDVSHWEGEIDFARVAAAGIVAVIAKATQGSTGVDAKYAAYQKAASGLISSGVRITLAPVVKRPARSTIT